MKLKLGKNVLPDLKGKFLEGANGNLGNTIDAGLPNITGSFGIRSNYYTPDEQKDEALSVKKITTSKYGSLNGSNMEFPCSVEFNASDSNPIYGKSNTVQPPAVCVNYIIKAK